MKRLENFKREDLAEFRKQIVLNSLFVSDYQNSLGISSDSACLFFDSFMSFIEDLAEEAVSNSQIRTGKSFSRSTTLWIISKTGTDAMKTFLG